MVSRLSRHGINSIARSFVAVQQGRCVNSRDNKEQTPGFFFVAKSARPTRLAHLNVRNNACILLQTMNNAYPRWEKMQTKKPRRTFSDCLLDEIFECHVSDHERIRLEIFGLGFQCAIRTAAKRHIAFNTELKRHKAQNILEDIPYCIYGHECKQIPSKRINLKPFVQ